MKTMRDYSTKYIFKAFIFCVVFTVLFVLFSFLKSFFPADFERPVHGIIGTSVALLSTFIFLKIDKKKFVDIGLHFEKATITRFLLGTLIGLFVMGVMALAVIYFSAATIQTNPGSNFFYFLLMTLPLILLALMEELAFRGYPLEIMKRRIGTRFSIILTSVFFALYHIANGWSVASSFLGPAIWGLIFGLAAVYSKGIAMSTGIHYAANLTTSAFGNSNEGFNIFTLIPSANKISITPTAIDWMSILPSLCLLIFAVVCIEGYMRRNKIIKNTGSN